MVSSVIWPVLRMTFNSTLFLVAVPCVFGDFEMASYGADRCAGIKHVENGSFVVDKDLKFGC